MIAADPISLLAAIDSNANPAKRFAIAFARGSVTVDFATWVIFCGPKGGEQIGDGR